MTVVVDASALVAAVVHLGADGTWSETAIAEAARTTRALVGPQMLLAEAMGVLRRLERTRRIESSEANLARLDLLTLEIELFPFAPLADRVWDLRRKLGIYDGWNVALANSLDCPLLTLDRRLARAAASACQVITPPPG